MGMKPVRQTRYDQCPSCHFPTRFGENVPGQHSSTYQCDVEPKIRTIKDLRNGHLFEFTCPHCSHSWEEYHEED